MPDLGKRAMLIGRERSLLLLVDVQERLVPAMAEPSPMLANCAVLLTAAARLGVPILASEQYPRGLGPTVPELRSLIPDADRLAKTTFACTGDPGIRARLTAARDLGRDQVIVCGAEAHVCVLQTTLGLVAAGFRPFVAADATASRRLDSKSIALERMRANGVQVATTEMVLFEWLGDAAAPEFRDLSRLIR